ncbi:DUF4097 family beta strand repeat-containing protein [Dinghuibacter silviterrae]|uniref:Adhesin n=1 Tax=Dinghuibacter silviterrae TaxID=1539049 RepID=A0A4R8DE32_9BACT|nr:hypothetical protein [Dinghuibacter silviterrae]TDW95773.1 hypothetical protein EDB95_3584 [Dinghuibacter silviterrae]
MCNLLRISKLFTLTLLLSARVVAGHQADKEKDYSKSYTLSASDKVSISNKFGKVDVHTWDKSEVQVDVHIKVSAPLEAEAETILNRIQIKDSREGDLVSFATDLGTEEEHHNHHRNQKFSIDYTVYMPAAQTLRLKNEFGSTSIPDYTGLIELTSSFGSLEAGRLASVKSLKIEFGKAHVQSVNGQDNGDVSVKFSKADVSEVSGHIDADFEFCNMMDVRVTSAIKTLRIKNSYTHLNLKLAPGIPARFDIFTNFGSLNNSSDYPIKEGEKHHDMFQKTYSGKSGDGSVDVILHDEFATVNIS